MEKKQKDETSETKSAKTLSMERPLSIPTPQGGRKDYEVWTKKREYVELASATKELPFPHNKTWQQMRPEHLSVYTRISPYDVVYVLSVAAGKECDAKKYVVPRYVIEKFITQKKNPTIANEYKSFVDQYEKHEEAGGSSHPGKKTPEVVDSTSNAITTTTTTTTTTSSRPESGKRRDGIDAKTDGVKPQQHPPGIVKISDGTAVDDNTDGKRHKRTVTERDGGSRRKPRRKECTKCNKAITIDDIEAYRKEQEKRKQTSDSGGGVWELYTKRIEKNEPFICPACFCALLREASHTDKTTKTTTDPVHKSGSPLPTRVPVTVTIPTQAPASIPTIIPTSCPVSTATTTTTTTTNTADIPTPATKKEPNPFLEMVKLPVPSASSSSQTAENIKNTERVFSFTKEVDRGCINEYATNALKQRHFCKGMSVIQRLAKAYSDRPEKMSCDLAIQTIDANGFFL